MKLKNIRKIPREEKIKFYNAIDEGYAYGYRHAKLGMRMFNHVPDEYCETKALKKTFKKWYKVGYADGEDHYG